MGIRCRRPLLTICGDVSRIQVAMGQCKSCPPSAVSLHIEQAVCDVMEESCEDVDVVVGQVCGEPVRVSCNRRVQRPAQKQAVTYPLHEVNARNEAVFILDKKFSDMGYGRYTGTISFGDCGCQVIDIDYSCGDISISGLLFRNNGGC